MASSENSGGGADFLTFFVGLIIIGMLAQVLFSQLGKWAEVPEEEPIQQIQQATTTES
jgi:hypothetical protein